MALSLLAAAQVAGNLWATREQARVSGQQAFEFADAARADYEALFERADQTIARNREAAGQRTLQTQRDLGRISAVIADSNITGAAHQRLVSQVMGDSARDVANIQQSGVNELQQIRRLSGRVGATTRSRMNSIQLPSVIGTTLQSASAVLGPQMGPRLGDLWDTSRNWFQSSVQNATLPTVTDDLSNSMFSNV